MIHLSYFNVAHAPEDPHNHLPEAASSNAKPQRITRNVNKITKVVNEICVPLVQLKKNEKVSKNEKF